MVYPGGSRTYTRKMRTPMAAGCDALYALLGLFDL